MSSLRYGQIPFDNIGLGIDLNNLTVRLTGRTGTKVGHSDPVVPHGRAIAHRIKGTLGITG